MESKIVGTQRYIPYHVLITKWLPFVRGPPPFYLASRIRDVFIALLMNNDVNIEVVSESQNIIYKRVGTVPYLQKSTISSMLPFYYSVETYQYISVADPVCLSRIRFFLSRIQCGQDPSKNLSFFEPKKLFLSSRKNDLVRSLDPDPDFFHSGFRDPKITGS
jgi:hypothetical protein